MSAACSFTSGGEIMNQELVLALVKVCFGALAGIIPRCADILSANTIVTAMHNRPEEETQGKASDLHRNDSSS